MYRYITKLFASFGTEYILGAIEAGATVVCTTVWYQIWKDSPEAAKLNLEIKHIHQEGRSRPVVSIIRTHSEFASSFYHLSIGHRRDFFQCVIASALFSMFNL